MATPLGAFALVVLAQAAAPGLLAVDASRSTLTFGVVHKLHKVSGRTSSVEGKVALLPGGNIQVMVRAPVSSFKSGDANRDEHMQEVLETSRYPYVVFKGVGKAEAPASFPATRTVSLQGELEFHGRRRPQVVSAEVEWTSPTEARVTSRLAISLDAFEVKRPSLLFVKIDDTCTVAVDLAMKADALPATGSPPAR